MAYFGRSDGFFFLTGVLSPAESPPLPLEAVGESPPSVPLSQAEEVDHAAAMVRAKNTDLNLRFGSCLFPLKDLNKCSMRPGSRETLRKMLEFHWRSTGV